MYMIVRPDITNAETYLNEMERRDTPDDVNHPLVAGAYKPLDAIPRDIDYNDDGGFYSSPWQHYFAGLTTASGAPFIEVDMAACERYEDVLG